MNRLDIWGLAGVLRRFLRRVVNSCKVTFPLCTSVDHPHFVLDISDCSLVLE